MCSEAEKKALFFTIHADNASSSKYFGISLFLLYKLWAKKRYHVTWEVIC